MLRQLASVLRAFGPREAAARTWRHVSRRAHAPTVRALRGLAATHRSFVDVGAAEGDVFVPVASAFGEALALEPMPAHARRLRERAPGARVLQAAAGAAPGRLTLHASGANPDDNSLAPGPGRRPAGEVEVVTLDDATAGMPGPVVVKVDVQGYELEVLRGATRLLADGATFLCEFWPQGLRDAGASGEEVLRFLRARGYVACSLDGRELPPRLLERVCRRGRDDRFVVMDVLFRKAPPRPTRVLVATHASELSGQSHSMRDVLASRGADFTYVSHPFPEAAIPRSTLERHEGGRVVERREWRNAKRLPLLAYAQHYLASRASVRRGEPPVDVFVGVDPLNALAGLSLRRRGRARQVVFWSIDYTPRRFANPLLNRLYHALDRHVSRRADAVWSISGRIAEVRRAQGVAEPRNHVVPIGVDFSRIPQDAGPRDPDRLVFMGHLVPSKGCDELLRAMEVVLRRRPSARLDVIGGGPHEAHLRALARDLKVDHAVSFLGVLPYDDMMRRLVTASVAVAPYVDDPDSITRFADPAKPKEYLACGLPVVITPVPWIADEIGRRPMGVVVRDAPVDLAEGILRLLEDEAFRELCRANAKEFVASLSWARIFENEFEALGERFPGRSA
ncbi:MAG TPA: FkbM family methyltransferase [Candidatus Thermoplasmatota archaeon]|nr:FkbM family methyltransferase [Candidatus Thermoplasmatota archaeon]